MSKLYSCPNCKSGLVYAGYKVIDQHFGVIQMFAGCHDCRFQRMNMVTSK